MRRSVAVIFLFVLDVIVTVFIGTVQRSADSSHEGRKIPVHPCQRKKYALVLSGFTFVAIIAYALVFR
jgi:hypothetical protein